MARLSFSGEALYKRCSRQYFIERVLGFGEWAEKPALWAGGLLHRLLESYYHVMKLSGESPSRNILESICFGPWRLSADSRRWLAVEIGVDNDASTSEALNLPVETVLSVINLTGAVVAHIVGYDGKDWHIKDGDGKAFWKPEQALEALLSAFTDYGPCNLKLISEERIGVIPAFKRHKGAFVAAGKVKEDYSGEPYSVAHLESLVELSIDLFIAYVDRFGERDAREWIILEIEGGGEVELIGFDGRPVHNSSWQWKADLKVQEKATGKILIIEFKTCGSRNINDYGYYKQKIGYCALDPDGARDVITRYTLKKRPGLPEFSRCSVSHKDLAAPCTRCGFVPPTAEEIAVAAAKKEAEKEAKKIAAAAKKEAESLRKKARKEAEKEAKKAGLELPPETIEEAEPSQEPAAEEPEATSEKPVNRAVSTAKVDTTPDRYIAAVESLGLDWMADPKYSEIVNGLEDNWFFKEIEFTASPRDVEEWYAGALVSNETIDRGWSMSWEFRRFAKASLERGLSPREIIAQAPLKLVGFFSQNPSSCSDFGGCTHVETCWGKKKEEAAEESFDL